MNEIQKLQSSFIQVPQVFQFNLFFKLLYSFIIVLTMPLVIVVFVYSILLILSHQFLIGLICLAAIVLVNLRLVFIFLQLWKVKVTLNNEEIIYKNLFKSEVIALKNIIGYRLGIRDQMYIIYNLSSKKEVQIYPTIKKYNYLFQYFIDNYKNYERDENYQYSGHNGVFPSHQIYKLEERSLKNTQFERFFLSTASLALLVFGFIFAFISSVFIFIPIIFIIILFLMAFNKYEDFGFSFGKSVNFNLFGSFVLSSLSILWFVPYGQEIINTEKLHSYSAILSIILIIFFMGVLKYHISLWRRFQGYFVSFLVLFIFSVALIMNLNTMNPMYLGTYELKVLNKIHKQRTVRGTTENYSCYEIQIDILDHKKEELCHLGEKYRNLKVGDTLQVAIYKGGLGIEWLDAIDIIEK